MSSAGQAVGGVVGAVAGFLASGFNPMGAVYGAQISVGAGALIQPPQAPTSARAIARIKVVPNEHR